MPSLFPLWLLLLWLLPLATSTTTLDLTTQTDPTTQTDRTTQTDPTTWPYKSYHSSPFHPPVLSITKSGAPVSPGYLFLTPGNATSIDTTNTPATDPSTDPATTTQTSPLILTSTGDLIWSGTPGTFANNLQPTMLDGKPVLTYWSGVELPGENVGHYYGAVHILDDAYDEIYTVCPPLRIRTPVPVQGECKVDGHESFLTERGTLVVTAYNVTGADLRGIGGGKEGWVYDCLVLEVDVKSGVVLKEWHSLDHISINATKNPLMGKGEREMEPFDYFHINSVQPVGEGWLVNARHTWATYLLDRAGDVVWTIQGDTGGDFAPLPEEGHFSWQHDARLHHINDEKQLITWFNNNNAYQDNGTAPSNGLTLRLDVPAKTAEFVSAFADPTDPVYADGQGNFQQLPNGNTLLFYGLTPVAKEFGPRGDTRWTARFGPDNIVQSYRMYKADWKGNPKTAPALVVKNNTGYVSWNGATEVNEWAVYEGPSSTELVKKNTVRKSGFETAFQVGKEAAFVQVIAYSGRTALRNSSVVSILGE